jgi:hypothetical protein
MPDLDMVVNSLKWIRLTGEPVTYDYHSFLPRPNVWERLRSAGIEPITVQPGDFATTPLSRVLYRGARFEPIWDERDLIDATVQLAAEPNRFIFAYVPHVDFAGHVYGLGGDEFAEAMATANMIWEGIASSLPPDAALLGTADHGLREFSDDQKLLIREPRFDSLRFAGDTRGVQLWGDPDLMADLEEWTGGELTDALPLLGPTPTKTAVARAGQQVLLAPDDKAFIPKGFDKRLRCYHGGLSRDEVEIPLLIG